MLTPRELLHTHFDLVFRGYNPGQVDEFVRRLVSEYENVLHENDRLKRQLSTADTPTAEQLNTSTDNPQAPDAAAAQTALADNLKVMELRLTNAGHKLASAEQEADNFHRRMRSLLQEYLSLVTQGEEETTRLQEVVASLVTAVDK